MPFKIVRADITKLQVDVIVNAANETLLGGGGVDGAIHKAAGPELLEECRQLGGCATGEAKLTRGYDLPAGHVIHTVGPVWKNGREGEISLLIKCYKNSLNIAKENNFESIAFPLISTGAYGFPKEIALHVAQSVIKDFLEENEMLIYLAVFDKESFKLSGRFASSVEAYIDQHYVDLMANMDVSYNYDMQMRGRGSRQYSLGRPPRDIDFSGIKDKLEPTFSESLLKLIDQKNKTDVQVYKKANLDRKLFSKIRNDKNYKPKKPTAIAFAIALELDLEETRKFLETAGYALSRSSLSDIIVEYYITTEHYNIMDINNTLFDYELPLLGL